LRNEALPRRAGDAALFVHRLKVLNRSQFHFKILLSVSYGLRATGYGLRATSYEALGLGRSLSLLLLVLDTRNFLSLVLFSRLSLLFYQSTQAFLCKQA